MTTACVYAVCKSCDNNAGGVCAYDHEAEFPYGCAEDKHLGLRAGEIVNNEHCRLFEPIETID